MANPRYICSLTSHFILSLSLYPYPFPSHSLTTSPISLSIHFHFPHFSSPLNPFPIFPTLAAHSIYPLSHSFLPSPSILQSRTIHIHRPYTLCHTFFPTPTHTCHCTHVVRSRIHILTFSCSPTNHTFMHISHET